MRSEFYNFRFEIIEIAKVEKSRNKMREEEMHKFCIKEKINREFI